MIKKRYGHGFTLAELLVVVAIIAVLSAVAIAVFSSSTESAEAAACAANRRSLKGILTKSHLLGEDADAEFSAARPRFACPRGGTMSYSYNKTLQLYTVACSYHDMGSAFDALYRGFTGGKRSAVYSQDRDKEGSAAKLLYDSLTEEQKTFLDQFVWNVTYTEYGIRIFFMDPDAYDKLGSGDGGTYYVYKYDPATGRFQVSRDASNKGAPSGRKDKVLTGNASVWGSFNEDGSIERGGWMDELPVDINAPLA